MPIGAHSTQAFEAIHYERLPVIFTKNPATPKQPVTFERVSKSDQLQPEYMCVIIQD